MGSLWNRGLLESFVTFSTIKRHINVTITQKNERKVENEKKLQEHTNDSGDYSPIDLQLFCHGKSRQGLYACR